MKKELLLVLIDSIIESKISDLDINQRGPRGLRGLKGRDFSFDNEEEKILLLLSNYIDGNKETFQFNFKDFTTNQLESFKLKFENLTDIDKAELKGRSGKSGKDFKFYEHEEKIFNKIESYIDVIKKDIAAGLTIQQLDYLKLKFEDLTDEETKILRGPRGVRGQKGKSGKDFSFEENKEPIQEAISSHIENIKEDLTLKLEDLNEEEIYKLKGPRGQKGKSGKDFIFDENKDRIQESIYFYIENMKESLALKFENLSEEEKDMLKLKFENLNEEEIYKLKGPKGPRGQKGKNGVSGDSAYDIWKALGFNGKEEDFLKSITGKDGRAGFRGLPGQQGQRGEKGFDGHSGEHGLDAPIITDIEIEKRSDDDAYFIFTFSNGTVIESNDIELPSVVRIMNSMGGGGGTPENFSYNNIVEGKKVTVPENQQMIVYRELSVSGELVINGEVFISDFEKTNRIVNTSSTESINIELYELIRQTASGIITSISGAISGSEITITNRSGGKNTLDLTIQGTVSPTIKPDESLTLIYNGVDYDIT